MNKITLIILIFSVTFSNAQNSWKKLNSKNYTVKSELVTSKTIINNFNLYSLDTESFKNEISNSTIIEIPINETFSKFYIKETSNFTKPLTNEYGYIKSFSLKGIDDKTATGKISIGTNGVYGIIFSGKHSTVYIDPYTKDKTTYISYKKEDIESGKNNFSCFTENNVSKKINSQNSQKNANDGILRTYRLALACTVEYADFQLENQGVSNTATDDVKKGAILSAMNTTITRVNGIFERDLAVTMEIVVNVNGENELIFLDFDELSNNDASSLINESQEICDSIIGSENYDIGHTFSTGAGGLATLGNVCQDNHKAEGVTGSASPIGDSFNVDFVAHEIGHQFGAKHTFNNSCSENRSETTSVEPGSGTTIMAYAGICSPNIQNSGDDYFHAVSINEMWNTIQNTSCASETNTNNTAPIVNAGIDVHVPKSTPLILKGEATDADSTNLTYSWEQTDIEIATMPPLSTNTAGPAFRSLPPTESPDRYLPALTTVIIGNTATEWEVIPSVAREMNFSLLVRDNNEGGGASGRDNLNITFVDTDPFIITYPNEAINWYIGTTQTITWDKSTTDQSPINCETVRIKLSTDGGETFPITLTESTPNDGSYDIIIPNQETDNARIMIESIDNIFYNVNSTNFSIAYSDPTFILSNLSEAQEACSNNTSEINYDLNVEYILGFSETVNLSVENLPDGAVASFSKSITTESDEITLTISGFENINIDKYNLIIKGSSSSINESLLELPTLTVTSAIFEEVILSSPVNNATNINIENLNFEWENSDTNATLFDLDIATDDSFETIILTKQNIKTNSYFNTEILNWSTTYYWRVKPNNTCGEGVFSSVNSFTTDEEGEYCTSTFTDPVDGAEYIYNVSIDSINNDSEKDNDGDGYENFTNISTNLIPNKTYTLSVSLNPVDFQDHCYTFIDWNSNSLFETTERYDLGNHFGIDSTGSIDITVPEDATLGETRMRVIIEYLGTGSGACDEDHDTEWGETEDYTLIITNNINIIDTDDVFNNFAMAPNPINSGVIKILQFDIPNPEEHTTLNLFDFTGRLLKSFNFENIGSSFYEKDIDITTLPSGIYLLNIQNGNKRTTKKIIVK